MNYVFVFNYIMRVIDVWNYLGGGVEVNELMAADRRGEHIIIMPYTIHYFYN